MAVLSIWMIVLIGFVCFIAGGLIASIFWIRSFKTLAFRLTEEEFDILKRAMYCGPDSKES